MNEETWKLVTAENCCPLVLFITYSLGEHAREEGRQAVRRRNNTVRIVPCIVYRTFRGLRKGEGARKEVNGENDCAENPSYYSSPNGLYMRRKGERVRERN